MRDEFKDLTKIEIERQKEAEERMRLKAERREKLYWEFLPLVKGICEELHESVKSAGWEFCFFTKPGREAIFVIYKYKECKEGWLEILKAWWRRWWREERYHYLGIFVDLLTQYSSDKFSLPDGFGESRLTGEGVHILGKSHYSGYKKIKSEEHFPYMNYNHYHSYIAFHELTGELLAEKLRDCFSCLI